jgi:heme/copper-type cytochrome/quinol oxidase subunit 2
MSIIEATDTLFNIFMIMGIIIATFVIVYVILLIKDRL